MAHTSGMLDPVHAMTVEQTWLITVAHLGALGLMVALLVLPFVRCLRSGKMGNHALAVWLGLMAWGALFCFYVPSKLFELVKNGAVREFFPESTGMIFFMLLGWLVGLSLCGVALALHHGCKAGVSWWRRNCAGPKTQAGD